MSTNMDALNAAAASLTTAVSAAVSDINNAATLIASGGVDDAQLPAITEAITTATSNLATASAALAAATTPAA